MIGKTYKENMKKLFETDEFQILGTAVAQHTIGAN